MDARNQMLCGYAAFGEYPFALANLRLLADGLREDGLLELCAPARVPVNIPSFSLIWVVSLWEYGFYSGDWNAAALLLPVAERILDAAHSRTQGDLLPAYEGYWNFYEWAPGLDGGETAGLDAALNGFYALALTAAERLCRRCGAASAAESFHQRLLRLAKAYETAFWSPCAAAYRFSPEKPDSFPELVQALALLGRTVSSRTGPGPCAGG